MMNTFLVLMLHYKIFYKNNTQMLPGEISKTLNISKDNILQLKFNYLSLRLNQFSSSLERLLPWVINLVVLFDQMPFSLIRLLCHMGQINMCNYWIKASEKTCVIQLRWMMAFKFISRYSNFSRTKIYENNSENYVGLSIVGAQTKITDLNMNMNRVHIRLCRNRESNSAI